MLYDNQVNNQAQQDKPLYNVPGMEEIVALPWNGHTVVSTFAGAGGSCLGFKMAGFRVLWASEFNEHAIECHRLNMPDTIVDGRDVREVQPEEILAACKIGKGDLDIFNGSPPCDSFSTAGKREKGWGKIKDYAGGKRQRTDDLFYEYIRLLDGLQPKVFIAENVSGMVKGKAKGYFKLILVALKKCGYRVEAKMLDAQWLGVPQMRQRIIFQGIRKDIDREPAWPKPLPYRYSVSDVLPWIDSATHELGGFRRRETSNTPSPTIAATQCRLIVEAETDIARFAIGKEWQKLKPGEQSKKYFQLVKADPAQPSGTITGAGGEGSIAGVTHPRECRKFSIAELKCICAFPDDFQLVGSYAKQWARLGMSVPPVMMFHIAKAVRDNVLSN